jgi:hypothetical protein
MMKEEEGDVKEQSKRGKELWVGGRSVKKGNASAYS